MDRTSLYRLTTPGAIPPGRVLAIGLLAMVSLCAFHWLSAAAVRVDVLYLFPLAAIALHCVKSRDAALGLILVAGFLLIPPVFQGSPAASPATDTAVLLVSAVAVVVLARIARQNYLENALLANTDALTSLQNRRSFESIIETEIARQRRYGGVFSVVLVDLGNFKKLNDTQGHQAGDKALKLLADVLKEHTRTTDSIARVGNKEFAVLMPYAKTQDCNTICNLLSALIATRMDNERFATSANIGFTTFEAVPESTVAVLQQAEKALAAAKLQGGTAGVVSG